MKVLIVDDDSNMRKVLATELSEENHSIEQVDCGAKALEMIEKYDFDVIVLDLDLPDISGQTVLERIKNLDLTTEIIILTGYGSISSAVDMIKLGAYDYVTKPYQLKKLMVTIEKAGERKKLLTENKFLKLQINGRADKQRVITNNRSMLLVLENAKYFAKSDFPVIILGESGVGKELLAEEIHKASDRADGPFIPINCGAIAENMIESELFGHEKGAFTSAHVRKPGLLEIANKGTLFLDEIGELPYNLQKKLLRVLDLKTFFRVGGTKQIEVDVRFVSATNKDLQEEISKGRFREDLYYRLTTLVLQVPPLRARADDIPPIVDNIIRKSPSSETKNKKFSKEAIKILQKYTWPGNIRELQNVIHRTLLLSNSHTIINPEDLPVDLLRTKNGKGRSLNDIERTHILNVMNEVNGKRSEAARILGIDPKTLYRKLQSFDYDNTEPLGSVV